MELELETVAAVACASAVFGAVAVASLRDAWSRRRRSRRALRALTAEAAAERLLVRRGYRVLARQARAGFPIDVDGARVMVDLRADLVVTRRGRQYVAEVKAGDLVASVRHGPTRRQLLEYLVAFGTDGVLLVDPRTDTVLEVGFPALGTTRERRRPPAGTTSYA